MEARPARVLPFSFNRSLFAEMAASLYASNAISLDEEYDPVYEASDSQIEGSKDSDSDDSDDIPVVTK